MLIYLIVSINVVTHISQQITTAVP